MLFQTGAAVTIMVLSALIWYAWLGWDTERQLNPTSGEYTGPYQVWQIVGCGASLILLLVGALWAGTREVLAAAALTVGFTIVWTADAARNDDSGLFAVGTIVLFAGLAAASGVIAAIAFGIRNRRAPRVDTTPSGPSEASNRPS
ncbi:hypothetical protein GCM10009828_094270 [Actinoplanes couchii]|uniref:Integral membrane protein n=1 Tax=Actinoplanes couchii TaxID=403638 RepID=A0ABQ3XNX3_9ACTN|nr:hypothetical protein Aco03nite_086280 [Actinoplanes couchii]